MKINKQSKTFESCPPFEGRAVCVDVTPLEQRETKYGLKQQFKLVFEVDLPKSDGKPYSVWTKWFTPSCHEKATFRLFMKDWFGRDLTESEWEKFDTEDLLGRPARVIVINEKDDDMVFANIKLILPHAAQYGEPLQPSKSFVRKKDREDKNGGSYKATDKAEPAGESSADDWMKTKVHVGKHRGHELRDLTEEAVMALAENWLPLYRTGGEKADKATADDRRLIAAIEKFILVKNEAAKAQNAVVESDDVPY